MAEYGVPLERVSMPAGFRKIIPCSTRCTRMCWASRCWCRMVPQALDPASSRCWRPGRSLRWMRHRRRCLAHKTYEPEAEAVRVYEELYRCTARSISRSASGAGSAIRVRGCSAQADRGEVRVARWLKKLFGGIDGLFASGEYGSLLVDITGWLEAARTQAGRAVNAIMTCYILANLVSASLNKSSAEVSGRVTENGWWNNWPRTSRADSDEAFRALTSFKCVSSTWRIRLSRQCLDNSMRPGRLSRHCLDNLKFGFLVMVPLCAPSDRG